MVQYAVFNNSFFAHKPRWLPQKLYEVVCTRANPRNKDYMGHLLAAKFPKAKLVEINSIPDETQNIILLYPDSIGLGCRPIEKELKTRVSNISILNGRGRYFPLTSAIRLKFLGKRFLEITFLPELLFAPILLLGSIILIIKDKLGART